MSIRKEARSKASNQTVKGHVPKCYPIFVNDALKVIASQERAGLLLCLSHNRIHRKKVCEFPHYNNKSNHSIQGMYVYVALVSPFIKSPSFEVSPQSRRGEGCLPVLSVESNAIQLIDAINPTNALQCVDVILLLAIDDMLVEARAVEFKRLCWCKPHIGFNLPCSRHKRLWYLL